VTATPAPAYDLTPAQAVEAFVDAWATGDPDAVAALLQPNVEYSLDTTAFPQYPMRSLSEVRMFVTSESQAQGGEFAIVRCGENAGEAGRVDCELTYRDGCIDALNHGPLHLAATFWTREGRISKMESIMPPKEYAKRHRDLYDATVWGQSHAAPDFNLWGNTVMTTEGAAVESGHAIMRMCAGYAASLSKGR
jgi:ketosteroid isomerase-like protein